MKKHKDLFPQIYSFENLLLAYKKARKGSGKSPQTLAFGFHLEKEILLLQEELRTGKWQPLPYHHFAIFDPKYRIISAAAFRDRVVHHALVNVIEPIYERCFIFDSYATRKGKGVHAARAKAQVFVRKYRWFYKMDIAQYFSSIDHHILIRQIEEKIKDKPLTELIVRIIRHASADGKGLPIGNLTSQFFANVYLDMLDHYLKDKLGIKGYLRYMDDFVIFSHDKQELKALEKQIIVFLENKLGLQLNPASCFLNQRANGLGFLGARIFPDNMRIRRENLKRVCKKMKARERAFENGFMDENSFLASQNSYYAYLESFDSLQLRRDLLRATDHRAITA